MVPFSHLTLSYTVSESIHAEMLLFKLVWRQLFESHAPYGLCLTLHGIPYGVLACGKVCQNKYLAECGQTYPDVAS